MRPCAASLGEATFNCDRLEDVKRIAETFKKSIKASAEKKRGNAPTGHYSLELLHPPFALLELFVRVVDKQLLKRVDRHHLTPGRTSAPAAGAKPVLTKESSMAAGETHK